MLSTLLKLNDVDESFRDGMGWEKLRFSTEIAVYLGNSAR